MNYALEKIKLNIAKEINKALGGKTVQASNLIFPPSFAKASAGKPNPDFGDLSLACFDLAKALKESKTLRFSLENRSVLDSSPVELASWLVGKIEKNKIVSSVKAVGPYLNFILNKDYLAENVLAEIGKEKENYGKNKMGKNKKVMIEYSNANTHKEYHVGHLRNICFGDAVNKILAANGYNSIPVSYINDFGIHVAKTIWYCLKLDLFKKKNKRVKNIGYNLAMHEMDNIGSYYQASVKELEKDIKYKKEVSEIMKKIESRNGEIYEVWRKTREWSIEQMDKIYKELGVKFSHIFYESEVIEKGLELAGKLYKKEILTKSEGAIIADLEKYNLGVVVFLRSDGTALYPVADLALAEDKFKKFKIDESIYVVDIRQGQYFKQLFKVLELMGFKQDMKHLGYEFVKLPSGMMSSRTGNVITYEDLRGEAIKKSIHETKKRHKDWSEKKVKDVAGKIVNGAIKFEMLKVGANQIITFDVSQALRFDGYTAAYLQYTYARIKSIIKKSKIQNHKFQINSKFKIQNSKLFNEKEYSLIIKLAKYPEVVLRAGENYDPSEIAKYLFELAQSFNDYYHSVPVLKAEKEIMEARLVLINSVARVIENGLGLLGIDILDEM